MKTLKGIRWGLLIGCFALVTFGLFTKQHLTAEEIIEGVAALLALSALARWGRGDKNRIVWNLSFSFLAGVITVSYFVRSGIRSFDTQFYGVLLLISLAILATRFHWSAPSFRHFCRKDG